MIRRLMYLILFVGALLLGNILWSAWKDPIGSSSLIGAPTARLIMQIKVLVGVNAIQPSAEVAFPDRVGSGLSAFAQIMEHIGNFSSRAVPVATSPQFWPGLLILIFGGVLVYNLYVKGLAGTVKAAASTTMGVASPNNRPLAIGVFSLLALATLFLYSGGLLAFLTEYSGIIAFLVVVGVIIFFRGTIMDAISDAVEPLVKMALLFGIALPTLAAAVYALVDPSLTKLPMAIVFLQGIPYIGTLAAGWLQMLAVLLVQIVNPTSALIALIIGALLYSANQMQEQKKKAESGK